MQAYEGQFLEQNSPAQADFDELVASQMNVITIAPWLQQHILRHYNFEPKQTFCVLNALDKTLWKPVPREPPRAGGRPVRFLVEGPVTIPARTLRKPSGCWRGSACPTNGSAPCRSSVIGPNCYGVEERVPYSPDAPGLRVGRCPGQGLQLRGHVRPSPGDVCHRGHRRCLARPGGRGVHVRSVQFVPGSDEFLAWSDRGDPELANDPDRVRFLQENALATAEAWPTWEDQADRIVATIESLVPFGRCSLVRQVAKNQYRSILQTQTLCGNSQPASDDADRAERAEAQLAELVGSRAMRLVRAIQRGRRVVAPDHSWRWVYIQRAGRLVWRAGRRIKRLAAPPVDFPPALDERANIPRIGIDAFDEIRHGNARPN